MREATREPPRETGIETITVLEAETAITIIPGAVMAKEINPDTTAKTETTANTNVTGIMIVAMIAEAQEMVIIRAGLDAAAIMRAEIDSPTEDVTTMRAGRAATKIVEIAMI